MRYDSAWRDAPRTTPTHIQVSPRLAPPRNRHPRDDDCNVMITMTATPNIGQQKHKKSSRSRNCHGDSTLHMYRSLGAGPFEDVTAITGTTSATPPARAIPML